MCGYKNLQLSAKFVLHRQKLSSSSRIQPSVSKIPSQEPLRVLDIVKSGNVSSVRKGIELSQLGLIRGILRSGTVQSEDHVSIQQIPSLCSSNEEAYDFHRLLDTSSIESESFVDSGYTPVLLSMALSFCASTRDLYGGLQYHGAAVRAGYVANSYVGSCLITLYVKFGELRSALKVFEEVPNRNVVSWTAIISGFAKEFQVAECLNLYSMMRESSMEPNDYTFSTLLTACTGSGALHQGRATHGQVICLGFDGHVHVKNALISMYCKCGRLEDALTLFSSMINKDVVSWNSMIAGLALHGLATPAIDHFEQMKSEGVKPDSITFLAVLSSCRHAGLVEEGRRYFTSMAEHGVNPGQDHYSCLVDLLGRAGMIEEALDIIQRMPVPTNAVIWGSLLSSCRVHGNVWIGIEAAESRLSLTPSCAATHVLLLNLYASARCWNQVARIRKLMKERALRTTTGCSWIEIKNRVFRFKAEEEAIPRLHEILVVLSTITEHMFASNFSHDAEFNLPVKCN